MNAVLSNVDLLWGMLCLPIYRHIPFPIRLLVNFWWERRGVVCGAKDRFGLSRRHVELAITKSLAFAEMDGILIADIDPAEQMVTLGRGPLSQRKQRLEMAGVYATYGTELERLAWEFNGCIVAWSDGDQAVARPSKRQPHNPFDGPIGST